MGGSGATIHKIAHHAQTKDSTQSYASNKGHTMNTTHTNVKLSVPVTGRGATETSYNLNMPERGSPAEDGSLSRVFRQ
jgi:hypothetical protein